MKRFSILSTLVIGSVLVATTGAAYGQLSGAIFTTDNTGTQVNGNNYSLETDVYLDGGPQPNAPCTSSGLTSPGYYYFQVTDPSGSFLLSTDSISQREVYVSGGIITQYVNPSPLAAHATSTGKCGSITVQLFPFSQTPNPGNEYKVWMTPVGSYDPTKGVFGFLPSASKTDNFRVLNFTCTTTDCPPPNPPTITGEKCYDYNLKGSCSWYTASNIVLIPGWKITSTDPNSNTVTTYTDSFGQYSFVVSPTTQYNIAEVMPNSTWIATSATSGLVTSLSSGDTAGPNFANVCIGAGGGLTLGFWSNKNGAKLLGTLSGLSYLSGLNLVNADGSSYTPSLSTFSGWLLSANATNMAYMLSAQMATMQLNVSYGKVNGSAWVYAPGTPSATTLGFTTINQLISDANTNLATNTSVFAGNPDRVVQQALETALDQANNSINFVQPGPASCPFTSPY